MTRPSRLAVAALAVSTAGVGCWRFKVAAAVRSLPQDTRENPDVLGGGCVGDSFLPMGTHLSILDALDPSRPPAVLEAAARRIVRIPEDSLDQELPRGRWLIEVRGDRTRDAEICRSIRERRRENGARVRQGWRFWSKCCPIDGEVQGR